MDLGEILTTVGVVLGIVIGLFILGSIARHVLSENLGGLVTAVIPVLALAVVAVGALLIIDPDQADTLLDSAVRSVPNIMVALIVVIIARGFGKILGAFVESPLRRISAVVAERARMAVSSIIFAVGIIIALQQIGISTEIINLLVAALAFGTSAAVALAVGLGSVPLARRVAAGRHVQGRFETGQQLKIGTIEGRIASFGLASTRLDLVGGDAVEIPNDEFLEGPVYIVS